MSNVLSWINLHSFPPTVKMVVLTIFKGMLFAADEKSFEILIIVFFWLKLMKVATWWNKKKKKEEEEEWKRKMKIEEGDGLFLSGFLFLFFVFIFYFFELQFVKKENTGKDVLKIWARICFFELQFFTCIKLQPNFMWMKMSMFIFYCLFFNEWFFKCFCLCLCLCLCAFFFNKAWLRISLIKPSVMWSTIPYWIVNLGNI